MISLLISKLLRLPIKSGKIKYVYSGTCPLNFSAFLCRSLTLHQSSMQVTILKPKVHRGRSMVWRKFLNLVGNWKFLLVANSWTFYFRWCKADDFFIWRLKKVFHLKQCPLYVFRFRDAWKERIYKTDGTKRVWLSQQGLHFREWPISAGFTHCLMIIAKYLSHKADYQSSGLNAYRFLPLFHWLK